MMKAPLYTVAKESSSEIQIPAGFSEKVSEAAMAQAYHVYRERSHTGLPQVQTRGEVSYTTKKMYRQKHTGNARHGSKRAPIFVGGGVTHGPKGVKTGHTLTKSLRASAKSGVLAMKVAQNQLAFVELGSISKTKEAAALIKKTGARSAVVAIATKNWIHARAFRNIADVQVMPWESLNVYPIMNTHMLIIDIDAVSGAEKPKAAPKAVKVAKKAVVAKPKVAKKK